MSHDFQPGTKASSSQHFHYRTFLWIGLPLWCGFRLATSFQTLGLYRIGLYSFPFLYLPAIFLHELAHAVAAAIVGTQVSRIKLGLTQNPEGTHLNFRFLGFPWELYSIPVAGSVHTCPINPDHYRTRAIITTAAGPALSLAAASTGFLYFILDSNSILSALLITWSLINAYIFLVTMMSSKKSDGMNIRKYLALTDEEIREKCLNAKAVLDLKTEIDKVGNLSLEAAIARHNAEPQNVAILAYIVEKMSEVHDPRQSEYVYRLVSNFSVLPSNLANFLDNYLTDQLTKGTITPDGYFDPLSQKLLVANNNSITARGTRGSVLIDLGRIEEGKALLKEVLEKTESTIDKTFSNIFLALAEKQQDNLEKAREYAKKATEIDPDCPALKRVSDLLKPSAT